MSNFPLEALTGPAWYSRLTPEGPAAVSIWKICGNTAWKRLQSIFVNQQGRKLETPPVYGAQCLGYLQGKSLAADEMLLVNRTVDDLPAFELHTHGGSLLARTQELILFEAGIEKWPKEPGTAEWPASSNLVSHLYRATVEAATSRGARGILHQSRVLPQAFRDIQLAFQKEQCAQVQILVGELLAQSNLAIHWTKPFQVTLLGSPNVGKSSLMNVLVGNQRAVVSDTPGTTLDLVRARIALQGWPIDLCDTAGMRQGAGFLEEMGIRLARKTAEFADLNLWLVEGIQNQPPNSRNFPGESRPSVQGEMMVVFTKADLCANLSRGEMPEQFIWVSSKTGEGMDFLHQAIIQRLTKGVDAIIAPTACTPKLVEAVKEFGNMAETGRFQEGLKKVEYWLMEFFDYRRKGTS